MNKNDKINKNGFLLGEFTLKMLVSIACIIILLFLLYKIYDNFTGKNELTQAEASLNAIGEEISSAVLSNSAINYILVNPKDWVLVYFGEVDQKPDKCSGNCLCICDQVGLSGLVGNSQQSACSKAGVCKNIAYQITGLKVQVIDKPIGLEIQKVENGVSIIIK